MSCIFHSVLQVHEIGLKQMKQKPSKKMKMEKAICQRGANKQYIFVDINCTDFSKGRGALIFVHAMQVYRIFRDVKCSRYRPGVTQRVGRGIALLFHDRGTRRGWVVSSTPRLHFTPGKDPVPILQEAGWAPGPAWTGGKSRSHRDSFPDRLARSSVAIPTELPCPRFRGVDPANS